ncbi:hypothetical protein C7212DRAFT_346981 [Tuber magnatum]|uniref:Uncharacterized protein n=1 Tax=Tuber magnatum TaxID=42249 RepID=A0A317SFE4_9PEZI|nr:hypothetical protein C7212DRAFT_346981 [Tuber magnatum]
MGRVWTNYRSKIYDSAFLWEALYVRPPGGMVLLPFTFCHRDAALADPISTLDAEQIILTDTDAPGYLEIDFDNELQGPDAGSGGRIRLGAEARKRKAELEYCG